MTSGGPWGGGGGGGNRGDDGRGDNGRNDGGRNEGNRNDDGKRGPKRPDGQLPEIEEIMRKGQEQLRVLMGGRGPRGPQPPNGGGPRMSTPPIGRGTIGIAVLAAIGLWAFSSVYSVRPEERSVELFLGKFSNLGEPGLNLAPWPFVTAEVIPVTPERTVDIGMARTQGGGSTAMADAGLMLTGDENIIDVDFQVVWNVSDPQTFLFNLRDPEATVRAVSESAMREIIAQSQFADINRDRGVIRGRLQSLIQQTLDSYASGINIVRVNFDRADAPSEVIDAFREVQAAEQQRTRLQNEADGYANRVLGQARGDAAEIVEAAEGYRAQVVNQAEGEASRFSAIQAEYAKSPEVTRRRLYLETMEEVLGRVDKVLIDQQAVGGQGVVPFLPLNELGRAAAESAAGRGAAGTAGGN